MLRSKIKLKKECWSCTTFNPSARHSFKCACKRSCPGLNWTLDLRKNLIKQQTRIFL